jgi:hypothetical protein
MTSYRFEFATDEPCAVHKNHSPRPANTELHHVWPKGMGGPDVPENLAPVCGTGHNNVHTLLRALVATDGAVPWEFERRFHPGERKFARLGFDRFQRGAL